MSNWGGLTLQIEPFILRRLVLTPLSNGFTHIEGQMYYDTDEKAVTIHTEIEGVSLQIGQESYVRVRNTTGGTINNGTPVYVSGASGNKPLIAKGQADDVATSEIMGVTTHNIGNNADGYVTTQGIVRDVDTSSFTAGDVLYLSPSVAGGITKTKPTAPDSIERIGWALNIHATQGTILVGIHKEG